MNEAGLLVFLVLVGDRERFRRLGIAVSELARLLLREGLVVRVVEDEGACGS